MQVKVGDIRRIVREEMDRLGDKKVIKEAASQPKKAAPQEQVVSNAVTLSEAAGSAAVKARQALSGFDSKWHRMVCESAQGHAMSDLVIELDKNLREMSRQRIKGDKVSVTDLQAMIMSEARDMGLTSDKVPAPSVTKTTIARTQKLISDCLFMCENMSAKSREKMLPGDTGVKLTESLEKLDDELARALK